MAVDRPTERSFVTRSPAVGKHGMAATSQPLATQAAIEILQAGGNAVDAAIAANAVLGVTEPMSCGLGGDLFAIVWDAKTKKLYGLNASGRSPRGLTLEEFQHRNLKYIPSRGPLSVSVPGCVDGWAELHKRFGKLPLDQVLAPAIRHAREGFAVTQVIARGWQAGASTLHEQPGFSETYMPGGHAPHHGETFHNPALASSLEKVAKGGRDAFYRGDIAHAYDKFMREVGGFVRYEDLADQHSEWVEPVSVNYRGYDVWELPPNGQGIVALQMLQMLKGFDLRHAGFGSPDHLHYFLEAKKLAFEDRARYYGDPAYYEPPVAALISTAYADKRRSLIDRLHAATNVTAGDPKLRIGRHRLSHDRRQRSQHGVAHPKQLPRLRLRPLPAGASASACKTAASCSTSSPAIRIPTPPASGRSTRSFPPSSPKTASRVMSFGVMGGDMQPQGHVQILVNLFDFDMGLQEAGDAPRVNHTGSTDPTGKRGVQGGGRVHLEPGFSPETVHELEHRGHRISTEASEFGGYQAIWYDAEKDVYFGATESRKDGIALGY